MEELLGKDQYRKRMGRGDGNWGGGGGNWGRGTRGWGKRGGKGGEKPGEQVGKALLKRRGVEWEEWVRKQEKRKPEKSE